MVTMIAINFTTLTTISNENFLTKTYVHTSQVLPLIHMVMMAQSLFITMRQLKKLSKIKNIEKHEH